MQSIFRKLLKKVKQIGPGFITGAADDDPSGIATYSIAGAQFGYRLNWLTLFLLPAMISIQEMCGRIGMVSGRGLAGVIRKYYSRKLLIFSTGLLAIANIINIGADLGIIAASMQMVLGLNFFFWLTISSFAIICMEIVVPYKKYYKVLKWLSLVLIVYVFTAFLTHQDWIAIAKFTLIPRIEFNKDYIMTMIGFLGTTISPYLFFWQASEEIEDEIDKGKIKDFYCKPRVRINEVRNMETDTKIGMFFSNVITFFIILTAAATLHTNGITDIETPQQVAMALKPLAGNFAYILFALGIIGIGWQSIPVLAGSTGYAFAEMFKLKEGLSKTFSKARQFYLIIAISTILGMLMNLFGINTIKALYYAAIINGITSIPLILIIIKLADDPRVVGRFKTKPHHKAITYATFGFMTISIMYIMSNFF